MYKVTHLIKKLLLVIIVNFQFLSFDMLTKLMMLFFVILLVSEKEFFKNLKKKRFLTLYFIGWLIPLLISIIYSEDHVTALKYVQKVSLVWVAPIFLFGVSDKTCEEFKRITKYLFPLSCIIFYIYTWLCLIFYWYDGYKIQYGYESFFKYLNFLYEHRYSYLLESSNEEIITQFFHKAYFGLFILFSIVFVAHWGKTKWIKWPVNVVLFTILVLLKAKAQILIGTVLMLFLVWRDVKPNFRISYILAVSALIVAAFVLSNDRLVRFLDFERLDLAKCAIQIAKKNLIFGVGIGDVQHSLDICYQDNGFSAYKGMNSHNQYLHLLNAFGLVGLFIFLFFIYKKIRAAITEENLTVLLMIIIFCISLLTENLINRMWGCMALGFFIPLFINYKKD